MNNGERMTTKSIKPRQWPAPTAGQAEAEPSSLSCEVPVITSEDLFAGRTHVLIAHMGEHYILKATKQGKLVLNK